jgi:hypothetical protein
VSAWLIAFVGLIYLYVAVEQYAGGNRPMALVFAGYALANVGLYVMEKNS